MSKPTQPPALPSGPRAVVTYLVAILLAIPVLMLLIFSIVVHLPKLERIWKEAGLDSSQAQWLLSTCRFVPDNFNVIGAVLVIALVLIECFCKGWGRWRKRVLLGGVFAFQLAVMLELAFVATASQLAVSAKMAKVKATP